ncbi:hypothetical protein [Longimicrobium sp.]|uniref:hypothetical protein n=1 Tax=Longimicrobium sp. TaxID=2029185 RepID=UPI003B3ADCFA
MTRNFRRIRPLFTFAIVTALGFGATQAVAEPGPVNAAAPVCTRWYYGVPCAQGSATLCANYCSQLGFANSACEDEYGRSRSCCACSN